MMIMNRSRDDVDEWLDGWMDYEWMMMAGGWIDYEWMMMIYGG